MARIVTLKEVVLFSMSALNVSGSKIDLDLETTMEDEVPSKVSYVIFGCSRGICLKLRQSLPQSFVGIISRHGLTLLHVHNTLHVEIGWRNGAKP